MNNKFSDFDKLKSMLATFGMNIFNEISQKRENIANE